MAKGKLHVTVTMVDFDSLVGKTAPQIYHEFEITCRLSKKRIIPARVKWNSYRVTREPDRITIHLAWDEQDIAFFSFARCLPFR